MLNTHGAGGVNAGRLRLLLLLFFLALAIPAGVLIWQAYSQLKWETFHQHRGLAEELTRRINTNLLASIQKSEARSFADFSFITVSQSNFPQQSALSRFPVPEDMPGLIGYFQVGSAGEFSTPLLPAGASSPQEYGISGTELDERRALAQKLRQILSNNQLVEHRAAEAIVKIPAAGSASFADTASSSPKPAAAAAVNSIASRKLEALAKNEAEESDLDRYLADDTGRDVATVQAPAGSGSQLAFDKLNEVGDRQRRETGKQGGRQDGPAQPKELRERDYSMGRVADLKLDSANEKKSADLELQQQQINAPAPIQMPSRKTRKEQSALAETIPVDAGTRAENRADTRAKKAIADSNLRISTFESEIDPLEFSLLDSGHFVLFRNVWRGGERLVQGMLLTQESFLETAIGGPFRDATISAMSTLIVAYQGDVLFADYGRSEQRYPVRAADEFEGELLYRSRLDAPFDGLELIYTATRLPPGPGAGVLAWVSLALGLVLCAGCYGLYRVGMRQIRLAQQQQDFVSAVSHELKTPLTSIRMYGEMLKEGWASEEKKATYYDFIVDESERLSRLISNVLQLANMNRNQPQLELKPVVVKDVMAGVASKISSQVHRAGFELAFLSGPENDNATISIDEDKFAQIIINLVDNAIKFSRNSERKRIEIGVRTSNDKRVVFSVRDFGPGIGKGQMRKIFDMFYRSGSELTRETVGTGIGLAIVHQLGTAMGASIDVLNQEPGAEFQISIPAVEGITAR